MKKLSQNTYKLIIYLMFENLSKLKEIQIQQQKQAQQASNSINDALELIAKQQASKIQQLIQPKDLQLNYSIVFATVYEKIESEEMEVQRKKYLESINQISKYNNPSFIQYVGIQISQEKQQLKKQQPKEIKKQNDKKIQKIAQITKKQLLKVQNQNKEKQKQSKQQANAFIIAQTKFKLNVLTEEKIQKFDFSKYKMEIKSRNQFAQRLGLACDLIQAMSFLNDIQYTIYPSNLEDLLVIKQSHIKLAVHTTTLWRTLSQDQLSEAKAKQFNKFKKQTMINPSLRYTSPEFIFKSINIKDIRYNDIWKTGVLLLTLLIGEDLSKDLLALQSLDETKIKDLRLIDESKIAKIKKYLRNEDVLEIMKMVSLVPGDRPPLRSYKQLFKRLKQQIGEHINLEVLQLSKQQYHKEKSQKFFKFMPQLKASEELLTIDHRKKLTQYFKVNQNRTIKDYKLIYRASQTQFSCKAFYEIAYDKKGLLIVICEKTNNKKLIFYSQEAFDLSKCNGVFGGYIKDAKKLSFIYSPQENQFCKLKNAQRAIGVSYIQGPIIGDGDLVISDGGLYNICKFPASYESLRIKKLLKVDKFELLEYDVYQVLF